MRIRVVKCGGEWRYSSLLTSHLRKTYHNSVISMFFNSFNNSIISILDHFQNSSTSLQILRGWGKIYPVSSELDLVRWTELLFLLYSQRLSWKLQSAIVTHSADYFLNSPAPPTSAGTEFIISHVSRTFCLFVTDKFKRKNRYLWYVIF